MKDFQWKIKDCHKKAEDFQRKMNDFHTKMTDVHRKVKDFHRKIMIFIRKHDFVQTIVIFPANIMAFHEKSRFPVIIHNFCQSSESKNPRILESSDLG